MQMRGRPAHYEPGGRGVRTASSGRLVPWLGRVVVASTVSLASLPALAANPPDEVAKPLLTQITASEYELTTRPDGSASAPNRAHGLRSTVSPRGFAFGPRTASGAEGWVGLHTRRAGTAGALVELAPGRVEVHGDRATVRRADTPIVEWVENRESGLEHGFTIAKPIAATADEPIVIELGIESRLRAQIGSTRVRFRHPDRAGGFGYGKLHAFDAAGTALSRTRQRRQAFGKRIALVCPRIPGAAGVAAVGRTVEGARAALESLPREMVRPVYRAAARTSPGS
jgi:hypothetical protein